MLDPAIDRRYRTQHDSTNKPSVDDLLLKSGVWDEVLGQDANQEDLIVARETELQLWSRTIVDIDTECSFFSRSYDSIDYIIGRFHEIEEEPGA